MRSQLAHVVVLVGVALTPVIGEASPITAESMVPNERSGGTSSADSWAGAGYASLIDASGDPILLLSSFSAFDPPGDHNKLRGGHRGGVFFFPTGGPPSGGSWGGFVGSGSWGGGGSPGSPGIGSFTLLSMSNPDADPDPDPDPDPDLNLNLDFGLGSGLTLSFQQCCEGDTAAVPEPSTWLLVGSGLAFGLRRIRRSARARSIAP